MINKSCLYQKPFFLKEENKNIGYDHHQQTKLTWPINLRVSALFSKTI